MSHERDPLSYEQGPLYGAVQGVKWLRLNPCELVAGRGDRGAMCVLGDDPDVNHHFPVHQGGRQRKTEREATDRASRGTCGS